MTKYSPDRWVVIKLTDKKGKTMYKILGSWYGGYLGSDSYRFSSGITKVKDQGRWWRITNNSGSKYICHKTYRGMSVLAASFLSSISKKYPEIEFQIVENMDEVIQANLQKHS